ncbi:hypothetical protein RUM43_012659 [Polyplax serrata]|uniref:Uncharacterized protein n=1 Tax=Polyplax serrata TaxID=468196 RepID=A0AAN8NY99_POLSC
MLEALQSSREKEEIGELYQDEKNQAALLVHTDQDGGLLVEGTIGHDLVVRPVPSSVRHLLSPSDDEMFLDGHDEDIENDVTVDTGKKIKDSGKKRKKQRRKRRDAEEKYHGHIVYKRSKTKGEDESSDYGENTCELRREKNRYLPADISQTHCCFSAFTSTAFMEPDSLVKKLRKKRGFHKREAPYVIFPEILVIVDYDGYRLHGGDNVQIKRYFVSFWNGVDLRYKLLKGPKIRISIAGIIISRGRDATPYLERNRVGRDAIDSAAALTDMGKYLFRERRLPVYDIAVAITK